MNDGKFVHLGGRFVLFNKYLFWIKWFNWIEYFAYKCNILIAAVDDERDKHASIEDWNVVNQVNAKADTFNRNFAF